MPSHLQRSFLASEMLSKLRRNREVWSVHAIISGAASQTRSLLDISLIQILCHTYLRFLFSFREMWHDFAIHRVIWHHCAALAPVGGSYRCPYPFLGRAWHLKYMVWLKIQGKRPGTGKLVTLYDLCLRVEALCQDGKHLEVISIQGNLLGGSKCYCAIYSATISHWDGEIPGTWSYRWKLNARRQLLCL